MATGENDKDQIKKYLEESGGNAPDDQELVQKIFDHTNQWDTGVDDTEEALKAFKDRIATTEKPAARVISMQMVLRIAAVLVIGLGLAYFLLLQPEPVVHQTAAGIREEIVLPDQSRVWLDAESKLTYDPTGWPDSRQLQLEGKALFEVEKGGAFVVRSGAGEVTVLGTSFTITDREAGGYRVECYTGKVSVKANASDEILTAGQLVYLEESALVRATVDVDRASAWSDGKFYYEQADLQAIFAEMERQYGVTIDFQSENRLIYTGSIDINQPVSKNLEKLSLIMGLTVEGNGDRFIISGAVSN